MTLTAFDIRRRFLDFFAQHQHTVVRSSPLVPVDPTLLFTNAGMVQFKDVFTGKQRLPFARAVSAQKCVRAGGKHNDLDNVGRTARHHTFFEMLGNFSFGDYFKEEAIALAWQFLHNELQLPTDRLWFTVFRGEDGIPPDDEARTLWQKIAGVSSERVLGLGKKENFWMMGDTGPQGPCSEIHVFQGADIPCVEEIQGRACLGPACDCDRYLEIWNLVFMQFERISKDGPLTPLPAPSIDTGAGLERLASVVQGRRSNYDTELFQPLIQTVAQALRTPYQHSPSDADTAMRILADHARATTFLIADGVMPSNLGRGYVLRSIVRRAIRQAVHLKIPAGFFATLCTQVVQSMGTVYPELLSAHALLEKTIQSEEEGFRHTMERGLKLIAENPNWRIEGQTRIMPGSVAFQLHDTFGFPLDLTQSIGREQGFVVDEPAFAIEMERQRTRSKFVGSGDAATPETYATLHAQEGATTFVGYEQTQAMGQIRALLSLEGEPLSSVSVGQSCEVIVDQTPFYGRSGGQVGDTGRITALGVVADVLDTWKPLPELIVHRVKVTEGSLHTGQTVELLVDTARRENIRKNHTATHLLHHVLRSTLGEHVVQKGSYVGPDKLTFDFSHFEPLSAETRQHIETLVNQAIQQDVHAEIKETTLEEARALGALALFGEKYSERVRVLRFGASVELCGGTHVAGTGQIGLFKIIAESSVAKGLRRLEALTGPAAVAWVQQQDHILSELASLLRTEPRTLPERIRLLQEDLKARDKEIVAFKQRALQHGASGFQEERTVGDARVWVRQLPETDPKILREAAAAALKQTNADVVVVGGADDAKVGLAVAVAPARTQDPRFHAGSLVGKLAALVGGKGGGRADLAQAGGTKPQELLTTLQKSFDLLQE